jgi:protein arginine kinase activator
VFRTGLEPLLHRIHRAARHAGKAPRRGTPGPGEAEALGLRRRLQAAIDAEQYEEAARLLDLLRKKEATDESGESG